MKMTKEQIIALSDLALAYGNLSSVWPAEWDGPVNFGGTLNELGLLPQRSLDEAEGELRFLLDIEIETPELVSCQPCGGEGVKDGEKCDTCCGSGLVSDGEPGSETCTE
ncbi:hypothetical protein [Bacillus sp. FJAT-28004]|uniref:hypothetical protein n=1 Tax=Bacillus sp. FJAT-28004 TaxID=1679165 RepID=UPI0006B5D2F2|nr:hypothetical protein [Bacillus sp. FJAT-28004]